MNLDQIEQDLAWARDNADRSAQTRLFVHHVPAMIKRLRVLEPEVEEVEEVEAPEVEDSDTPENGEEGDGPEEQTGPEDAPEESEPEEEESVHADEE